MRIRIQKRAEVTGGLPAVSVHTPGTVQQEGYSLPIDYTIEGRLVYPITVGLPVHVERDTRNGVPCMGEFITSLVVEVTDKSFRTKNSVYDYYYLTPENN